MSQLIQASYKSYYRWIFVIFYLIQGFVQGIPILVFNPYLSDILGNQFDIAKWLTTMAIGTSPWAFKFIVGFFNDRFGSKKYGVRFPWIFGFGLFGAFWWIYGGIKVNSVSSSDAYTFFRLIWFMTALGMAFADTALDGLILDVTPQNEIAKIQGLTWTMLLIGMGIGGMALGLIFMMFDLLPVLFILTGILMVIACFLPKFIQEKQLTPKKDLGKDVLSIFTKKSNWKVFLWTLFVMFPAMLIVFIFNIYVLVNHGILNMEDTLAKLQSGESIDLLIWNTYFYLASGIGTVLGSLVLGWFSDKDRIKGIKFAYLFYIPVMIFSLFSFNIVVGLIFQLLIGMAQAAILISGMSIRADITRKNYPMIMGTYYSLLVALCNAGQNIGSFVGGKLIVFLASLFSNFTVIYIIIAIICTIALIISYLFFKSINPEEYKKEITNEKTGDVFFT